MKRSSLAAGVLIALAALPGQAMDCEPLMRWPDLPSWVCTGEPAREHDCAFWATAGLRILNVVNTRPTFPIKRLQCTYIPRADSRVYALWQTYHTHREPWPSNRLVTEPYDADLKWFMAKCPVAGYRLP